MPSDWRFFPSGLVNKKNTLARLSLWRIEIYLTLPFLDLSDEPSPPPSPSLLSSGAVSAMLSSAFPSMMGCVGTGWGGGRVLVATTEMGEKMFFF